MKRNSLKTQAMITTVCGALVRLMGFFLRLLLSRLLGAEALGVMELASGAHMLALTPAASGLPSAVSRLTARAETPEKRALIFHTRAEADAWLETIGVGPERQIPVCRAATNSGLSGC